MATSIHGLSFIASVDTKQLEKGMVLTRKELSSARALTDKYKSSSDKLAETQEKLNRLVQAGKITRDMANAEMREAIALQEKLNKKTTTFSKIGGSVAARAGGLMAGVAGAAGVSKIIGDVTQEMERLDRLGNLAERLSLPVESLQRISFVTDRFGQIDAEGTASSLVSMTKAISDSAAGVGKAKRFFEQFGIDAQALNNLPIEQKFLAMAEAARGIANEGDRLSFVKAIFGDEAMVQVLSKSNMELEAMMQRLDELGGVASAAEVDAIAAAADSWQEAGIVWSTVLKDLAVAAAPLAKMASDVLSSDEKTQMATGIASSVSAGGAVDASATSALLTQGAAAAIKGGAYKTTGAFAQAATPTFSMIGNYGEAYNQAQAVAARIQENAASEKMAAEREADAKRQQQHAEAIAESKRQSEHLARIEEITRLNQERIEQWKREGR